MIRYKNTCIVLTAYTLSLYLLKMPLEEIRKTYFICNASIPKSIVERLPHYYYDHLNGKEIDGNWKAILKYRLYKFLKWPFIFFTRIYAQDHQVYISQIIGHQNYILMEDGPRGYDIIDKTQGLSPYVFKERFMGSWKSRIKYYLIKQPMSGKQFGTNPQCINRWITNADDISSPYIDKKPHQLLDYKKMWKEADEEKKKFVLHIYNISTDLINMLDETEVMLFTQPLMEDCRLSEQELFTLYKNALLPYFGKKTLIKPHPRDGFNYEVHFPDTFVFRSYAPMQLLSLIGANPQVAITVSSTAMSEMPETTNKVYLGTKIHPKIYDVLGDQCNS